MKWEKRRDYLEANNYRIIKKDEKYILLLTSFFDQDKLLEESKDSERLKKKANAHRLCEINKNKCFYCKEKKGNHRAHDYACPIISSKSRIGYTNFSKEQKFKAIYKEKNEIKS